MKGIILIPLMDEPEKIHINGKVGCFASKGAHSNRQAGIAVRLFAANFAATTKIEEYLGAGLVSVRSMHTMRDTLHCMSLIFAILASVLTSPD